MKSALGEVKALRDTVLSPITCGLHGRSDHSGTPCRIFMTPGLLIITHVKVTSYLSRWPLDLLAEVRIAMPGTIHLPGRVNSFLTRQSVSHEKWHTCDSRLMRNWGRTIREDRRPQRSARSFQPDKMSCLTLRMLRLHSSKAQGCKNFLKTCHIGIHWIALAEYSQLSIHVPGF